MLLEDVKNGFTKKGEETRLFHKSRTPVGCAGFLFYVASHEIFSVRLTNQISYLGPCSTDGSLILDQSIENHS